MIVCTRGVSFKNTHEPIAAVKGTKNIKLLALLAPNLEVAIKKKVVANAVVIVALKNRFAQKAKSAVCNREIFFVGLEIRSKISVDIPYIQNEKTIEDPYLPAFAVNKLSIAQVKEAKRK